MEDENAKERADTQGTAPQSEGAPGADRVRMKICGLRTEADVRAVNRVLPDFAGFIFVPGRRRYIAPEEAEKLRRMLDPRICPVGVFQNAGVREILDVLHICHFSTVQLHGQETQEEIRELREAYHREIYCQISDVHASGEDRKPPGQRIYQAESLSAPQTARPEGVRKLRIIQAFRISSSEDVRRAEQSEADLILLDHGAGGTGESFDWSLLEDCRRPFLLAGGLTPENVTQAVRRIRPWGVDVSSSLETDGRKDPEKIQRFAAAVRAAAV